VRKFALNYNVLCLVRKGSSIDLLPENSNIKRVEYDKLDTISDALKNCDVLIHSAALTRARDWQTFKKINIDLTEELLNIANQQNMKQFIFISSQAAAGPALNSHEPVLETDECKPISMYGMSKLLSEDIIKNKAEIPYTIIRPVSVFGPGDSDFLQFFKMIKYRIAPLIGFEKKCYNFIYVKKLVELIEKSILNRKALNQTFFAADSNIYTMKEFVQNIEKAMNKKSFHFHIPRTLLTIVAVLAEVLNKFSTRPPILNREKAKELKQKNWIVSTEKTEKILAFKVQADLTAQLKETYKWYKDKGWL